MSSDHGELAAPAASIEERAGEQPGTPAAAPRRRRLGWTGLILCIVLIAALLGIFIVYRIDSMASRTVASAADRAERLAGALRDMFVSVANVQPKITINDQVIFEQSSPVMELAVVERQVQVERDFDQSWYGSTKHIRLRGLYAVKAGYDLRRPFSVRIEGANGDRVKIELPAARLLGVEQKKVDVLRLENGLWNSVQPGELQGEINALAQDAREKARAAGLAKEAETTFAAELREKIGEGRTVEIETMKPAAPSQTAIQPKF